MSDAATRAAPHTDWVWTRARTHPRHPALEAAGETLSYAQLEARVAAAAAALRAIAAAGEPVALLAGNGVPFAVFAHAVPRARAILLPLNARLTAGELASQLRTAHARTAIVDAEHAPLGAEAAHAAGVALLRAEDARWTAEAAAPGRASADAPPAFEDSTVHSAIFTSGTAGAPKAVLLTYGNFAASAAGSTRNLGVDPTDRWLACLPLFHVGGLSILLRSAINGTTAVLLPRFDAASVNRALRAQRVTLLSVVPTMLQRMLDADRERFPPSVRAVLVGGGPVTPALLEAALGRGLTVLQSYGLTEAASQVTTLSAADARRKLGSAGLPLQGVTVRVEIEGRVAAPDESGEIVVAGPMVSPGYLGAPPRAPGEPLRTGDLGSLDAEGYLTVGDRRDDLIVSGGENVSPAEVEAALLALPGVDECAVVGLADREWGQAVAAVVVPAPGAMLAPAVLLGALRGQLAGYKLPRRLEVSGEPLPRTASGKLLRRVVRERLEDGKAAT
ncbi:MAG: 2-succinylbenzoate-CoA ligase [Dehalococcoidia bacterium]|nr:2-succinylbenzoate-CoA ligase [Dehalococcoidia bacterium]